MAHINKLVFNAAVLVFASTASERAAAEVVSVAGNGFEIRETAHVAASPDKVYAALLLPAHCFEHIGSDTIQRVNAEFATRRNGNP
jgi:hypothetical protein